jgi:hypothetical protein
VHINLRFETLKLQYGFCRSQQGRHVFTDRHMSIAAVKGLTVLFCVVYLFCDVTYEAHLLSTGNIRHITLGHRAYT